MIKDVFVIEGNPKDRNEALMLTFKKLFKEGCVKESFYNGCVEREKVFPTGLCSTVSVAIPHTDAVHVISPAICVLRLENPVNFVRMDDFDNSIDVEYIFNMALESNNDQLEMLQNIIDIVKDSKFLQDCKGMSIDKVEKNFKLRLIK